MSFPTAAQSRVQSTDNIDVLSEIHVIERAVLDQVKLGNLIAPSIGGDTIMTSTTAGTTLYTAQEYFNAWKGTVPNESKAANMQSIIDYFSQLGYGIKRVTNPNTGTTFLWYVTW